MEEHDSSGGLFTSIRTWWTSLVGLLETRIELFAIEWQEEKLRTITMVIWAAVGAAFGIAALLVAVATLALFLWRTTGYAGLLVLAAALAAVSLFIFVRLRRRMERGPAPFAATVEELRKDAECLRRND